MNKIHLAYFFLMMLFNAETKDIVLKNPSFEGMPHIGIEGQTRVTDGWQDCGFYAETAPDIQPSPEGTDPFFGVNINPKDGKTYIGMVTRDNETYESIGQELSSKMEKGSIYQFSVYLSKSEVYKSVSRKTNQPVDYTAPVLLRIWAGNKSCDRGQLLAQSDRIFDSHWQKFETEFKPNTDWSWIIFEVYYYSHPPLLYFPRTNGNILIDHCSTIKKIKDTKENE